MAAVEIFEEEFGTWHEGSLVSLEADGAVVRYKDDWTAQEKLPLSRVRAAAPPTPNPFRPKVGERVEVRTHTNDGAPQSWWLATITKLKAEFVYVHYEGWSDSFDEIVDLSRVRPPNPSPAMSAATFTTAKAVVPESIAEWCANSDNHTEFCQQSKLFSVHMDDDNKHLVLQGTKDNVELAMALIDVHFKRLMDRKRLHDFKTRSQSRMEEGKNSILKKVLDIPPELIGLAIGKGGANFIKARAVPGVLSVEIINEEGYDRVRVVANSQAAIDAATDIIYFTQEQLQVPRKHASRLIGTQGNNLLDIVSKSNCIRITVQPTHGNEPVATLNLVGSQKAIQLAKVLIHAHLQLFEERDSIEEEFRSVHSKLSELGLEPSAGRGMRSDAGMGRGGYRSPRGQPSDRRAYGRGDDYGAGSGRGGSSSGSGSGGYAGRGGRGGGQARGRGGYGGGAGRGNNNGDSGAAAEGGPGSRQITLFTDGTVRVKMPSGGERADEAADDVVQPRRRQNRGGEAASASAAATPSNAARQEPKPRGAAKAPATAPATPAQPQQQQQQQPQQPQPQQQQQSQQSQSARRAKPAAEGSNANANANANNANSGKGGAQAAPASAPASAARPQGSGRPARGANAEGGANAGGKAESAAGGAAAPAAAAANSNTNSNSQVKEQRAPRGKPAAASAAAAAGGSAAAPAATNGHANAAAAASAPAAAAPATTAS